MKNLVASAILILACSAVSAAPERAADPALKTIYHDVRYLSTLKKKDSRAVILFFMRPGCPVVRAYVPFLKAYYEKVKAQKVQVIGIYTGAGLNVSDVAMDAQDLDIPFPTLLDYDLQVTDLYKAERYSETVLLDADMKVRYQGAIDDQYFKGGRKPAPLHHYLEDALTAVLAGAKVDTAHTPAQGCLIERDKPEYKKDLTYNKDVAPILQKKCQACHRPGEVGPFKLMTYQDAKRWADVIEEVIVDRRMPPWPANSPLEFKDDQRMSEDEIRTIVSWANTGKVEGDPKDAPKPISWPDPKDWKIGKPDFIFKAPPVKVPATGVIDYQYFLVPANITEDRWIQAIQVRPGDPRVVHHIQVLEGKSYSDEKDPLPPTVEAEPSPIVMASMLKADAKPAQPLVPVPAGSASGKGERLTFGPFEMLETYGFSLEDGKLIAGYTPGNNDNATIYPPDYGLKLGKGAKLIFELHYTPFGKEVVDESEVGIIFRKTPPRREIKTQWFYRHRGGFTVPAQDEHFLLEKDDVHFRKDVLVHAMRLHLHQRGKNYRIEKVDRAGKASLVIQIPSWDFNWQRNYYFKEPIRLLGGEHLRVTAHWDNSDLNPHNPDPNQEVHWGEQTQQEMLATLVTYEEIEQGEK